MVTNVIVRTNTTCDKSVRIGSKEDDVQSDSITH